MSSAQMSERSIPDDEPGAAEDASPQPAGTAENAPSEPAGTAASAAAASSPARSITRRRLIFADALIALTTLLAIVGMLSVWANRLLFDPDNWGNTSTQLLQNADIRSATANYVVDQLYANVDVAGLIKSGLPAQLAPLAGPAAGALRSAAVQGAELALTRPEIQSVWATANRAADRTFIAIVNGGKGAVKINNGAVTLDLASIVDDIASRLGLPAGIGEKLPPSVAKLTVFKSDQLNYVQKGGRAVRSLALWLTIAVPLLYALAVFLARGHRRRTLMTVGFAVVFAGVLGIAARTILTSQVTDSLVADATLRPAVRAVVWIATAILGDIASAFIVVGAVLVLAAWFAGPARLATTPRRAVAPFLREQAPAAFAITAAVMVVIYLWDPIEATGTAVGIIGSLLLALFGLEMLRRQTALEFPDAQRGEATAAIRARVQAFRERRQQHRSSLTGHGSLPEQLERLAALRDSGELTREEYDGVKAGLLARAVSPSQTGPRRTRYDT